MVCYKAWKRTVIEIDQKLPVEIIDLDETNDDKPEEEKKAV